MRQIIKRTCELCLQAKRPQQFRGLSCVCSRCLQKQKDRKKSARVRAKRNRIREFKQLYHNATDRALREIASTITAAERLGVPDLSPHQWRKAINEYYRKAKAGPCTDCGTRLEACCMDFDHVRGTKVAAVSTIKGRKACRATFMLLQREIAKCDLVCAACHRIRTARRPALLAPRKRRGRRCRETPGTLLAPESVGFLQPSGPPAQHPREQRPRPLRVGERPRLRRGRPLARDVKPPTKLEIPDLTPPAGTSIS